MEKLIRTKRRHRIRRANDRINERNINKTPILCVSFRTPQKISYSNPLINCFRVFWPKIVILKGVCCLYLAYTRLNIERSVWLLSDYTRENFKVQEVEWFYFEFGDNFVNLLRWVVSSILNTLTFGQYFSLFSIFLSKFDLRHL